jgi:hypothetical protein
MISEKDAQRLAEAEEALRAQLIAAYEASQEQSRQHEKLIAVWGERDRIAEEIGAEVITRFEA